jgi:hypothetical protein
LKDKFNRFQFLEGLLRPLFNLPLEFHALMYSDEMEKKSAPRLRLYSIGYKLTGIESY